MIRLNMQNTYSKDVGYAAKGAVRGHPSNGTLEPVDSVQLGQAAGDEQQGTVEAVARQRQRGTRPGEDRSDHLAKVMNTLPRDHYGRINPDSLVDDQKKTSLTNAVERLVLEGLGTGADIAFEKAVHALFAEYADDLGLDEAELAQARKLMLKEVREVIADDTIRPWSPDEPAPAMMDIESAIERLQQRVQTRRQMILEASGDLSRVLAELTVDARSRGPAETEELGVFVHRMKDAIDSRSSFSLRRHARQRLLALDPTLPTDSTSRHLGDRFLDQIKVS